MTTKHFIQHILLFAVLLGLLTNCQPVSQESLAGTWKPDLTGIEAKIEAEIDKKTENATALEKVAAGLGKSMVPKLIKSLEEMRLDLKADGSYTLTAPKMLAKLTPLSGKWKLSEDNQYIILGSGVTETRAIKVNSGSQLTFENKKEEKDNFIPALPLVRAE